MQILKLPLIIAQNQRNNISRVEPCRAEVLGLVAEPAGGRCAVLRCRQDQNPGGAIRRQLLARVLLWLLCLPVCLPRGFLPRPPRLLLVELGGRQQFAVMEPGLGGRQGLLSRGGSGAVSPFGYRTRLLMSLEGPHEHTLALAAGVRPSPRINNAAGLAEPPLCGERRSSWSAFPAAQLREGELGPRAKFPASAGHREFPITQRNRGPVCTLV